MRIRKYQGSGRVSAKDQIDDMIMEASGRDMPFIRSLNFGDDAYAALLSDFSSNPEKRESLVELGLALAPKDGEKADIMGNRGKIKESLSYLVDKGVNLSDVLDQAADFVADRDDLNWAQKKIKRATMGAGVTALGFEDSGKFKILKGGLSMQGYKNDSPDKDNDFNIIPSNNITMKGVDHDVLGVSDSGDVKHMKPGRTYKFSGRSVLEVPMYQSSGEVDPMRFVKALAGVESGMNYRAQNPNSSAVGAHQFLWDQLKKDPMLKGVSKEEYLMDEDLQDRVMLRALTEPVAGGNPYEEDVKYLRETYAPQIPGFNEMFSDLDLYLMRHLKGRQGSREYLGYTIRDKEPENLKGLNMPFPKYKEKFYGYYNQQED